MMRVARDILGAMWRPVMIALACAAAACSPSLSQRGVDDPDDDGLCPTARGNDQLDQQRMGYMAIMGSLQKPPPLEAFNKAAEELGLPFRWSVDQNADGRTDPREMSFGSDTNGDGRVSTTR